MMGKWELDDQALKRAYQQAKPDRGGKQMQGTIEKLIGMGRAEGRVLGQVELLTRMLNSKFGPLPKRVRGLLRKASLEELNAWAGVALDAKSLDAIFGKPPANP